jgi:hypothetical protein
MKVIKTSKGKEIFVDDEDFEFLNKNKWCLNTGGYARCSKNNKQVLMHRFLMNFPTKEYVVDHIDGNKLNNQKSNLRICSQSQNLQKKITNDKGFQKNKAGRYQSRIRNNYKIICLGTFDTKNEAIKAYNNAAKNIYGEFAKLNKIEI